VSRPARFNDVNNLWREAIYGLIRSPETRIGSRDGDVAGEIIGYRAALDAGEQRTLLTNETRALPAAYAAAETLWYFSGEACTAMIERYAPSYSRFSRPDGTSYGAYGSRLAESWSVSDVPDKPRSCVERVISMLSKSPGSRQAVIALWHPHDLSVAEAGGCADIPCTLTWQFLVRGKKLHMLVNMRSNDAWLGLPNDVFAFTCFQRVVASHLGVGVGLYIHQAGSLHLYERDLEGACRAVGSKVWAEAQVPGHEWKLDDTLDSVKVAVELERELRVTGALTEASAARIDAMGSMSKDLFLSCARKLTRGAFSPLPISRRIQCSISSSSQSRASSESPKETS